MTIAVVMRAIQILLLVASCGTADKAPERETVVPVPPAIAKDIARTLDDLQSKPPEPIAAKDRAAAIDPKAIVGTWKIKQLISTIDHKARPPSEPIVPGTWTFKADGTWQKRGGNDLDGRFVLTAKGLVIEALGPALEYRVDKLTATELMVTATIMDGMSNATILEREK